MATKKTPSYWSDVLQLAKASFGAEAARSVEDSLEIPPFALDGVGEADPGYTAVRHAGIKLAAGDGYQIDFEDEKTPLKFRSDYLRSIGVTPGRAVVVRVTGRSMEPMIPDGAVLLVNQAAKEMTRDGLVYAFRVDDSLLVKKLYRRDDSLLAVSENPDREQFPDRVIGPSADFSMIGRVVWMGASL